MFLFSSLFFFFPLRSYKDCIDVNIVSSTTPVLNRYGLNATAAAPSVIKQDHCEFTNIPSAQTLLRKLGPNRDASQCIADCKKNAWCTAVQVVRAFNPPTAVRQAHELTQKRERVRDACGCVQPVH